MDTQHSLLATRHLMPKNNSSRNEQNQKNTA